MSTTELTEEARQQADDEQADPAALASAGAPALDDDEDDAPPDLRQRVLCPDGACIGVVGPDGRCKVCGQRAEPAGASPSSAETTAETTADTDEAPAAREPAATESTEEPFDLDTRRLCSDGTCIGVIGADDRCKVCGKPYLGDPES